MHDQTQTSVADRSPIVRLFRGIRRMLIVLAWTVTAIALLYGEENWRGRRTWTQYRQALEARGEQFDLKALIPKPVPDDQNFAITPFAQSWFDKEKNSSDLWMDDYSRVVNRIPSPKDKRHWRYIDLVAWQMAFQAIRSNNLAGNEKFESNKLDLESRANAAPAVLEGLKSSDDHLAELRDASRRPYARYPVFYDLENPAGILLPHLAKVKAACTRLQVRACAELAAGRGDSALADVKLMFYLADSVKEEPFLISYLVRLACVNLAVQPIWEGLAERRWSDAQLQELENRLQYNLIGDLKHPYDGERASGTLTADLLFRHRYSIGYKNSVGYLFDEPAPMLASLFVGIAPHGWFYLEQYNYCRLYENQLRGTFDLAQKRVFPSEIANRAHELEYTIAGGRLGRTVNGVIHHQWLASLLLPQLGNVPRRSAAAQATVDQARLACALERFRLATGQFPESLEMLAPKYLPRLPNDAITGEPCKYRRNDLGGFVLYSVGWDQRDDGGVPGKTRYDDKNGDWVWEYQ
jgi:hypothetical protein